jgi:hypothetical protein
MTGAWQPRPEQPAQAQPAAASVTRATTDAPPPPAPEPRRRALPQPPADPPPPPRHDPAENRDRTGPSGRTGRLHVGWHSLPRSGLRHTPPGPGTPTGLILGRDRRSGPVPLPVFAPEPTRVALVGGLWAAQLLIFRAFALGARVIVVTTDPRAWSGFGERATGQYNRLTVLSSDQGGFPAGTAQMPTLTVYDLGAIGPAAPPPLGPWHTRLTILRRLDRDGLPTVHEADLVLLQRLGGEEATLAATALRLPADRAHALESLADDMLVVHRSDPAPGGDPLLIAQTAVEQQLIGPPRR